MDVIPDLSITQPHIAMEAGMFVWADCLLHEFGEICKVYPLWLVTAASTKWARDVSSVSVALAIFSFTHCNISLAITLRTGCQDMYFEHVYLLSV
jgi:hypothetical protein